MPCSSPRFSTPWASSAISECRAPSTVSRACIFSTALLIDLALLGTFAIQHSLMARPYFKRWLTQFIPASAERSTYVLFSSVALIALFAWWEPIGGMVWDVADPVWRVVLYSLFAFGWGLVLLSTFLINHFDLFGLRQIWLQLRGRPYTALQFGTPGPYRLIRHPLYLGWFFAFWATPTMSVTHLVFALATTAYILIAIQLEERDLIDALGDDYRQYRARVPMIIPFMRAARGRPQPEIARRQGRVLGRPYIRGG